MVGDVLVHVATVARGTNAACGMAHGVARLRRAHAGGVDQALPFLSPFSCIQATTTIIGEIYREQKSCYCSQRKNSRLPSVCLLRS